MSVHLSSRVWKDQSTTGNERLLLLALADMSNDEGVCWPSIATLRERINVQTDRAVQKLLAGLEESGWIAREIRPSRSTVYRLLIPENPARQPRPTVQGEQPDGVSVRSGLPRPTVHHYPEQPFTITPSVRSPRTIKEPSREPSSEPSRDDDDEIRPVLENKTKAQAGGYGSQTPAPAGLDEVPLGFRSPDPEPDAAFLDSLGEVAPLPAAPTRRDRQRADTKRRLEILALIQAFGEVRYNRAPDAHVTTAEFEKVGSLFAQLWELGVTPTQVKRVVAYAMKTWPDPKTVQPRTVVERWSGLLADSTPREPAPRPASSSRSSALPRAGGGAKQEAPAWRPRMLRATTSGSGGIIPPMPQADGTISPPMIAQDLAQTAQEPVEGVAA